MYLFIHVSQSVWYVNIYIYIFNFWLLLTPLDQYWLISVKRSNLRHCLWREPTQAHVMHATHLCCIRWVVPLPSKSDLQDYCIFIYFYNFLVGDACLKLHLPLLLGRGLSPKMYGPSFFHRATLAGEWRCALGPGRDHSSAESSASGLLTSIQKPALRTRSWSFRWWKLGKLREVNVECGITALWRTNAIKYHTCR